MIDQARMLTQLELHEGLRLVPYVDTEGYLTIGIGYNISSRGWDALEAVCGRKLEGTDVRITPDEARRMAAVDAERVEKAVRMFLTPATYDSLEEPRQRVCVDMAFNMGHKASRFHQTIKAVKARDWSAASREMYRSKWANQVGDGEGGKFDRAERLSRMMLTGQDFTR